MAKYQVTMACGHTVEIQLYGKESDRDKKIAWLEKHGLCTECQKAAKAAEHAEATAKAAEKAMAENLPELTGTEKQINWALTIRAEKLAEIDSLKAKGLKDIEAQAIKNVLASNTEAKFWIDNRDLDAKSIIQANKMVDAIKAEVENLKKAAEEKAEVENNNAVTVEENVAESAEENETVAEIKKTLGRKMKIKSQEIARLSGIASDATATLNAHIFQERGTDVVSSNDFCELNKKVEDAVKNYNHYLRQVLIRVDVPSIEKAIEVIKQIAPGEYNYSERKEDKCYESDNGFYYELEHYVYVQVDRETYQANAHRKDFFKDCIDGTYKQKFEVVELWQASSACVLTPNGVSYEHGAGLVAIFVVDTDKFIIAKDEAILNNQSICQYHILEEAHDDDGNDNNAGTTSDAKTNQKKAIDFAKNDNGSESAKTVKYQIKVDADMTIGEIGIASETLCKHYHANTKLADVRQKIFCNGSTYVVIDNPDLRHVVCDEDTYVDIENPELIIKNEYFNGASQNVYTVPAIKIGSTVDVYKIDGKDFGYLPIYDLCYLVSDKIDWQSPDGVKLSTHTIFKVQGDYNRVCDCTNDNATTDDNVDCEEYLQNLMDALGANNGDKVCDDIGYNLGKVFATCQHIINFDKGECEHYYSKYGGMGMLCALPRVEFALIQQKTQPALKKIKLKNAKLAEMLGKELAEVISKLPADLPRELPPAEPQCKFGVGYWKQLGKLRNGNFGKIPAFVSKTKPVQNAALQAVLNSSREVIDDLKDED